ncbi:MAG: hypothetical protein Q7S81_00075 [bacterium]|nr:hypothetical protein [bacterium]
MEQNELEKKEVQKRFDALPENLKKEILADKNAQIILSTCQDYKISEEDTKKVALLAGEVFLGYIKPEEVASELNKYFGVELQKSNFIEIELKQKIFNGLRADLDKIYNPLKIEVQPEEEASPAIIKLESEAISPSVIPGLLARPELGEGGTRNPEPQNLDSRVRENDKKPVEPVISEAAPFIIHTNVEAVKAAVPQFPKESPSLNLKVDPSIIQKNPTIKPISVHLETTEPVQGKRFQMPVIAGQKIFSGAPQPTPIISQIIQPLRPSSFDKAQDKSGQAKIEIKPAEISRPGVEDPRFQKESGQNPPQPSFKKEGVNIPIQPLSSPSLKEISEQKTVPPLIERKITAPEPAKVVHYSAFKTELTNLGTPKKPEPTKESFINLNTFTKVSGNTVDLRSKSTNNE